MSNEEIWLIGLSIIAIYFCHKWLLRKAGYPEDYKVFELGWSFWTYRCPFLDVWLEQECLEIDPITGLPKHSPKIGIDPETGRYKHY